jgi:hypothetical protein
MITTNYAGSPYVFPMSRIRMGRAPAAREFPDQYAETLILDARTGVLVHMRGGTIGKPRV